MDIAEHFRRDRMERKRFEELKQLRARVAELEKVNDQLRPRSAGQRAQQLFDALARVEALESLIDRAAMTLMRTDGRVASDVAVMQVWRDCVSAIESKDGD